MDTGLSARLKFLDESAHLLALAAPETSSFLEAQHGRLLAANGLAGPDSRRGAVCGACGNIMAPGWSCHATQETKKTGKSKVYACVRCHGETRMPLPASKPRRAAKHPSVAAPPAQKPRPAVQTANASSKKRAKARKGGLQALLASSKKESGFGLELMDLMRSDSRGANPSA